MSHSLLTLTTLYFMSHSLLTLSLLYVIITADTHYTVLYVILTAETTPRFMINEKKFSLKDIDLIWDAQVRGSWGG